MLCAEFKGSRTSNECTVYKHSTTSNTIVATQLHGPSNSRSIINIFKAIFLPDGYPESVSDDYLAYQVWDTAQAFCSSINGTLATHAVLKGAGVGDEAASVASATLTWLLKDGIGMISRISFAYYKGTSLDHEAKKWRLFADVLNDVAISVQLVSPLLPKTYFTAVMCASGVAFSLVGVAGGCTRAALTMHQAKKDNMADVAAKDGSQETLVNLTGLVVSLLLTPYISGNLHLTWFLFFTFAILHVFSNYKAVSSVVMDTVNYGRLQVLVEAYHRNSRILNPVESNKMEPFLTGSKKYAVKLGSSLNEAQFKTDEFLSLIQNDPHIACLIQYNQTGMSTVAIRDTATAKDIITACSQVMFMRLFRLEKRDDVKSLKNIILPKFIAGLEDNGWDLTKHHLSLGEYRWTTNHMDKIKIN